MEAGDKRQLPNFQRLLGRTILKIKVIGSLGTVNALSTVNGELKTEGWKWVVRGIGLFLPVCTFHKLPL